MEQKQLREAVEDYRKLKDLFTKYPPDDKFRKVEWYNNVLASYESISNLKRGLHEHHEQQIEEARQQKIESEKVSIEREERKLQLKAIRTK